MAKMCHQAHVDTSRDPLALSSNPHLATTESEAGSNDCYLQEPGKRSSLCLGTNNLISEIRPAISSSLIDLPT